LQNLLDMSEHTAIVTPAHPPSLCFFGSMLNAGGFFSLTNEISIFILKPRIYPPSDQPKGLWRGFVFYDIYDCGEISCLKNL